MGWWPWASGSPAPQSCGEGTGERTEPRGPGLPTASMSVALSQAYQSPRQVMEPQLGSRLAGRVGALQEGCVAKRREPAASTFSFPSFWIVSPS